MKKYIFLLFVLMFVSGVSAETNGVWVFPEDIRGGTFGSDEAPIDNFTFVDDVYVVKDGANIVLKDTTTDSSWRLLVNSGTGRLTISDDVLGGGRVPFKIGPGANNNLLRIGAYDVSTIDVQNGNFIVNNGNVGIGTYDPQFVLQIKDPLYGDQHAGFGFDPASNAGEYNWFWGYQGKGLQIGGSSFTGNTYDRNEIFLNDSGMFFTTSIDGGNSLNDRFTILNNGNIGIGTADPQSSLQIKDPSYGSQHTGFGFRPATNANEYNWFWGYEGKGLQIGGSSTGNVYDKNEIFLEDAGMFFKTSSTGNAGTLMDRFTILNNGNVGVGLANPSVDFEVSGTMRSDELEVNVIRPKTGSNVVIQLG